MTVMNGESETAKSARRPAAGAWDAGCTGGDGGVSERVTGGRALPQAVIEELQHRYAQIGLRETPGDEAPPLTKWTMMQGSLLEEALGSGKVYVGMRNWHPLIADVVAQMRSGWRDQHQGGVSGATELADQRWTISESSAGRGDWD